MICPFVALPSEALDLGKVIRRVQAEALVKAQGEPVRRTSGVIETDGVSKEFVDTEGRRIALPKETPMPGIPSYLELRLKEGSNAAVEVQKDAAVAAYERHKEGLEASPGLKNSNDLKQVEEAFAELESLTKPLLKSSGGRSPASADSKPRLDVQRHKSILDKIEASSQSIYEQALQNNDSTSATRAAGLFLQAREQKKSYYGAREADNYMPVTYMEMFNSSLAACKVIIDPDESDPVTTSGVLIGPQLVLTCAHEVKFANKLAAEFVDEKNQMCSHRPAKILFEGKPRFENEGPLDYTLLQIEADPSDVVKRKPMILTRKRPSLDAAVYAIGHPGGGMLQIHDHSRVVLPHMLKVTDRPSFLIRVQADLLRQNMLKAGNNNISTLPAAKDAFMERYREEGDFYVYHSQLEGSNLPVFGVDTDTFRGNSGGAIVLRRTGHVCGILIEGMEDDAYFDNSTILSHERCLPAHIIIDQMNQASPGWASAHGVAIQ